MFLFCLKIYNKLIQFYNLSLTYKYIIIAYIQCVKWTHLFILRRITTSIECIILQVVEKHPASIFKKVIIFPRINWLYFIRSTQSIFKSINFIFNTTFKLVRFYQICQIHLLLNSNTHILYPPSLRTKRILCVAAPNKRVLFAYLHRSHISKCVSKITLRPRFIQNIDSLTY